MERKYYEAYDDRYRQVHGQELQWFADEPSPIVAETVEKYGISPAHRLLELGCGEGRDAIPLLSRGYDLLATDVSDEAIGFCRRRWPQYAERFQVLDCVAGELGSEYDFIYAVAVIHMLVPDRDRAAFYTFVREHLSPGGIALICTMGDGTLERCTDIGTAFLVSERVHEGTGKAVSVAGTSCRTVSFGTFERELTENGLTIIDRGITSAPPDFPVMMYAVVSIDL